MIGTSERSASSRVRGGPVNREMILGEVGIGHQDHRKIILRRELDHVCDIDIDHGELALDLRPPRQQAPRTACHRTGTAASACQISNRDTSVPSEPRRARASFSAVIRMRRNVASVSHEGQRSDAEAGIPKCRTGPRAWYAPPQHGIEDIQGENRAGPVDDHPVDVAEYRVTTGSSRFGRRSCAPSPHSSREPVTLPLRRCADTGAVGALVGLGRRHDDRNGALSRSWSGRPGDRPATPPRRTGSLHRNGRDYRHRRGVDH